MVYNVICYEKEEITVINNRNLVAVDLISIFVELEFLNGGFAFRQSLPGGWV